MVAQAFLPVWLERRARVQTTDRNVRATEADFTFNHTSDSCDFADGPPGGRALPLGKVQISCPISWLLAHSRFGRFHPHGRDRNGRANQLRAVFIAAIQ